MHSASTQLALQSAAHLAAKGEYRAARLLIESVAEGEMPTSLRTLHAKILVQQGKYREALDDWREVLRQEPDNQEAQAALDRTERLAESRWHWLGRYSLGFRSTMLALVLGAGVLIAAVAMAGLPFGGRATAGQRPSPAGPSRGQGDGELPRRIADLETTVREQTDLLGQQLTALRGGARPEPQSPPPQEAPTREMPNLQDRVSAVERAASKEIPQSMAAVKERLAALERSLQDQQRQIGEANRQLEDRTGLIHRDLLVCRLSDLCQRLPLTGADLNSIKSSIRYTARKLIYHAYDVESQDYAERVIEWLDERYAPTSGASEPDQRERQRGTSFRGR